MTRRLAHRGPDGEGLWEKKQGEWNVAFGHRRLAIIDLATGDQPLHSTSGELSITFNGEIFNFQTLRSRLEQRGHRFKTKSDTEVILEHYAAFGDAGLRDLNGMFAFAIWDHAKERGLIARDRCGIKPLYYAPLQDGGVAFSSELTSLLEHPGIARKIDSRSLADYFFSDYVSAPRSLIAGVRKLPPGHYLVWSRGQLSEPKLYWSLDEVRPAAQIPTEQALKDELWEKLGEAVERQLIADVPVGIFLSGGIDSSVIAAVAQRRRREPLTTFTIAFEDPDFDESAYARTVASHLKTHHIEKLLSRDALFHYVDRALDCLDEPLADPSVLPTYLLSELAREHVKVVLGGDGGDELWSGYPTYWAHHWGNLYGHFPKVLRQGVVSPLVSRLPLNLRYQSFEWKAKRFFLRWDEDSRRRHLRWMSSTDLPLLRRLLPGGPSEPASLADGISLPETDAGNALLALDFKTYLPGSVLAKVDRASMAHGLEVRPPFLDAEIVDFSFSLPSRLKQRKKIGKYLLKAAAQGKLPDEILHRKKKGFGIPLARWLRGPLEARVKRVLAESPAWDGGVLSREAFQLAYDSLVSSREDTSKPLWALLVLDHWMRKESLHVIE